jgi:Zn-dependent protease with chaperone function
VGWEADVFGKFLLFVISLVMVPAAGLFAANYGRNRLVEHNNFDSVAELAAVCAQAGNDAHPVCGALHTMNELRELSLIALAVTLALPLIYVLAALVLGRDRNWLARLFPALVRVMLGILPLVLIAHGLLLFFASWEGLQMGLLPTNLRVLAVIAIVGGTLILAALGILADMRRMLEIDPLRVSGTVVERHELPALFDRVARIAARLGSQQPQRIIIGAEPTAFVVDSPLRLRGVGDLPPAETLYLPACALRTLEDAELDALIGHELGHFRGADLEFSRRFAPAFRSLWIAAESVDNQHEAETGAGSLALIPAIGMLAFMLYSLTRIVSRINREREFAADRAALEVITPEAMATLLVKFGALSVRWQEFHQGLARLLHAGVARRNISLDYLAHTRAFLDAVARDQLARDLVAAHTPHPMDSHPTTTQRAAAVGADLNSAVSRGLESLRVDRLVPAGLDAIEERISTIDADFHRHPAQAVVVSQDPALPPELLFRPAQLGQKAS